MKNLLFPPLLCLVSSKKIGKCRESKEYKKEAEGKKRTGVQNQRNKSSRNQPSSVKRKMEQGSITKEKTRESMKGQNQKTQTIISLTIEINQMMTRQGGISK